MYAYVHIHRMLRENYTSIVLKEKLIACINDAIT